MTKPNLIDIIYVDNCVSEYTYEKGGVYYAAYDDGSMEALDEISNLYSGTHYHDLLGDIQKCIDRKDKEKATLIGKYNYEIRRLQKINNKMSLELQRLQQFEEEIKSQKQEE